MNYAEMLKNLKDTKPSATPQEPVEGQVVESPSCDDLEKSVNGVRATRGLPAIGPGWPTPVVSRVTVATDPRWLTIPLSHEGFIFPAVAAKSPSRNAAGHPLATEQIKFGCHTVKPGEVVGVRNPKIAAVLHEMGERLLKMAKLRAFFSDSFKSDERPANKEVDAVVEEIRRDMAALVMGDCDPLKKMGDRQASTGVVWNTYTT